MSPILGIYASSQQTSKLSNYYSISTATVTSGGTTTITFSSIPSTYTHLQIRCFTRSTATGTDDNIYIQLNGSSASSYAWHRLLGDGASVTSGANSGTTLGLVSVTSAATAGASIFGPSIIDILDYTNTNKNRTVRAIGGNDHNGGGYSSMQSFSYFNTTAVTSITVGTGAAFDQYSSIALYGIK